MVVVVLLLSCENVVVVSEMVALVWHMQQIISGSCYSDCLNRVALAEYVTHYMNTGTTRSSDAIGKQLAPVQSVFIFGVLQCISSEVFVPCLVDLCKALWELMKSYHRTIEWHRRHDDAMATQAPATASPPPAADAAASDANHGLFVCFVFALFIHLTFSEYQHNSQPCRWQERSLTVQCVKNVPFYRLHVQPLLGYCGCCTWHTLKSIFLAALNSTSSLLATSPRSSCFFFLLLVVMVC